MLTGKEPVSQFKGIIQPGDLIFFPSKGYIWDWAIQLVSPKYTHVAMVLEVNDQHIVTIDANLWRGIATGSCQLYPGCVVKRVVGMSRELRATALTYALSQVGSSYNIWGAMFAAFLRKIGLSELRESKEKMSHCSEFIVEILRKIFPTLFPNISAESILPDDLLRLQLIEIVS